MNFLQRTPFFRLLLALITGIVAARYIQLHTSILIVIASMAITALLWSWRIKPSHLQFQTRWLFGLGVLLLLFVAGYGLASRQKKSTYFPLHTSPTLWMGEITQTPEEKTNTFACAVRLWSVSDTMDASFNGKNVLLYLRKNDQAGHLKRGDILLFQSVLTPPSKPLNPHGFNYAEWLQRKGIAATGFVDSVHWKKVGSKARFDLTVYAEKSRDALLNFLSEKVNGEQERAVLAALTLGYRETLDPELSASYSDSGAMHILSVSGLHVGIVYWIINTLLSLFLKGKVGGVVKVVLAVCLLWCYAFITGLPPSVIRAATMFSLVAIGQALERKAQIYNTISVSAFLILIVHPPFLYDIGFQLSYAAVASIVYFQPVLSKAVVFRNKALRWCWDLTTVSLAAQLGTLPLALYYFKQFPNYFLITNFVAIPLATLIIYTAVSLLFVFWIPYVSTGVANVLEWLVAFLNHSVTYIQQIPGAVTGYYINDLQLWLLFSTLLLAVWYIESKQYWPLLFAFFTMFVFVGVDTVATYQYKQKATLLVFADHQHTHLNIIEGTNHVVFTTDSLSAQRTGANFWKSRKLTKVQFVQTSQSYAGSFQHKKWVVVQDDLLHGKHTNHPISTHYLILGNGVVTPIPQLLSAVKPQVCIADHTIPSWYARQLADSCRVREITFYHLKDHGAYFSDLEE